MKVILMAPLPPPAGGIALWTKRMVESTLPNGWEVDVVNEALIGNRSVFGDNNKRNLKTEYIRLRNIIKSLKDKIKDEDVKIVHSCIPAQILSMIREAMCARIAHKNHKKFVVHFRCTVPNICKSRISQMVLKRLEKHVDGFILLNQQSVDFMKTITQKPLYLIPNFITENELIAQKSINKTIKTALYVGGCIKSKGCMTIIDIAKRMPQIEFRMVGVPSEEVLQYAKGINNVVFLGEKNKESVKEELKRADVFLFLSFFMGEGFSNSLVEAMAAGLPCIVSNWAANKDMVGADGGYVIPCEDAESGYKAMEQLMDSAKREKCSINNINKVKNEYVETIVLKRYIDCYEEIINSYED